MTNDISMTTSDMPVFESHVLSSFRDSGLESMTIPSFMLSVDGSGSLMSPLIKFHCLKMVTNFNNTSDSIRVNHELDSN
jgi:hypothetical protein